MIISPNQHTDFFRKACRVEVVFIVGEVSEQEATRRLHPLVLQLPQPDLVDDCGRQNGLVGEGGGAVHLFVGVGGEVGYDLVGGDAKVNGLTDGGAGEAPGDHVWEAHVKLGEEGKDGDLEGGLGVGVEAVVCLDDDAACLLLSAAAA